MSWTLGTYSTRPLHARNWRLLHHWPQIIVSLKNLPNQLESLQKSHLIVLLSTFQISRTSASTWDSVLYFWYNVNFLSNSFPWIQMLPMSKTWTFNTLKNVCCCLVLHLLKNGPISFTIEHLTLCKNDLDDNDMSDSALVSACMSLFSTINLSVCSAN